MRQKPTGGYAARIQVALSQGPRPMSVRALAAELAEQYPDVRGTSYGGVRSYAEDRVQNPRIELLRAMAEVLGVRGDWLAFGEGERTEIEQAATAPELEAAAETERRFSMAEEALQRIAEGAGPAGDRFLDAGLARVNVLTTWRRLLRDMWGRERPFQVQGRAELEEALGRALVAPLEALRMDPATLSAEGLTEYVSAVAGALRTLSSTEDIHGQA